MRASVAELVVDNVVKEYPTPAEPLRVLGGVSFELQSGENLAILGPSGSGKSTLLHVIGGLEPPTSGTVMLDKQDPFTLGERELAHFRNRNIGFIFQEHHLLPQLNVLENVLLPTIAEGKPDAAVRDRARDLLERVGLSGRLTHRPAELSGGERERVAVARSLIRNPVLLLADEPTGNLDRKNAVSVGELLLELQKQENTMLIVVTHSLELADMLARRVELEDGVIVV
ncbi:MAG: ABC transporter ATP-binding protein [Planctomycetes bacterium]|nr:ABC transporter ATP-binding protein [Planctomycetota bacterium]